MKKLISIVLLLVAGYFGYKSGFIPAKNENPVRTASIATHGPAAEFDSQNSNTQVNGSGRVVKILPDDNDGSRHQRFIIQLASGQTLLVAHNIDLADRVSSIKPGDTVEFNGEYEWNSKGGVIHWTHRDPKNTHISGWIKHNGRTYQ